MSATNPDTPETAPTVSGPTTLCAECGVPSVAEHLTELLATLPHLGSVLPAAPATTPGAES